MHNTQWAATKLDDAVLLYPFQTSLAADLSIAGDSFGLFHRPQHVFTKHLENFLLGIAPTQHLVRDQD